ncbi:MAG: cysteine--tRNA ligase [Saprospiraceae bacterium]
MSKTLVLQNSLSRKKEEFIPLEKGYVGMYVCGPTVYSNVHLGNIRTFVSFDMIYRHLIYLGYQVRYVRNVTDVGHLTGDSDDGDDKISERARLEKIEPMEVVQKYTLHFHEMARIFNMLPPSIEPRATGHIIEQIEMVEAIIDNGFGYVSNGSVYFDTAAFMKKYDNYGKLSGRIVEDLLVESRDNLKKQNEKKNPSDFAIWMKAGDNHLMKWNSPWSIGFPGWHLECSAMSTKYLGKTFDIHGGGNDLKFPHHENEIAQSIGSCGCSPAKYWLHTNMLLLNGKKMSKSDGNTVTAKQLFDGTSEHATKPYTPMVIRFFMLQAHYGSTLDMSDNALQGAEKGYQRLMEANRTLQKIDHHYSGPVSAVNEQILTGVKAVIEEMNDDFNSPKAMARLFELVPIINSYHAGKEEFKQVSDKAIEGLKKCFTDVLFDIFGLVDEMASVQESASGEKMSGVMELVLDLRQNARTNKDWPTSDKIRDALNALEIVVKDEKEGSSWTTK